MNKDAKDGVNQVSTPRSASRLLGRVIAVMLLTVLGGCRKSDAERAAQEREEIEARIRDAYSLVPYRALKLTMRAEGQPNAPAEIAALWQTLADTRDLPAKAASEEEALRVAKAYLDLGVAFYKAKKTLEQRDEDEFPLLWNRFQPDQQPPLPGYDAGQEHAFLSALWFVLDAADSGNRVPATDLVLYELSRATLQPAWPPGLRVSVRGSRGMAFCGAGYHYAAEEELNAFLSEAEAMPASDFPAMREAAPAQVRETLLATGYFLRAWNRMGLKRERAAEDDLERGLGSLEKLGIENELTWWGWAFIHFRRERYDESARYLDTLAKSPYLGETERRDLQASADAMRKHGERLPIFLQARAAAILGQALVARAGGPEKILVTLLGPERAGQVLAPILWMDRVRQGLAQRSMDDIARAAGDSFEGVRAAGSKGLSALKEKLLGGGGDTKTAAESPP
ncbi:hypothetical protein MXAN_3814 [Myxococcus xanthus DK 1622]|uniref:Uncharacterized protein n=1 Tax=Myxococcus xanthus (strain DK1622) TaxID=246197 RepID=Q1D5S7_MYXXD|nr:MULTISPECIES: hypothetical protein [Myxococcus]ABF87023.1 hypothetical protein MXAN_3814 [Myxococcus xanthus DK 1622]NOJ56016.1 hypothetical protein [Myxococcus xanthus]QPM76442.1 hypothetical protein I5Q59_18875 [Myxococcus xanthus]QVW65504.1 hypothetical protein JTM82_24220 [Myxococcus xanthus DZ2]QZZ51502.1 hypothetical protein MyxoNM_20085 [Myxococcus xanthus]